VDRTGAGEKMTTDQNTPPLAPPTRFVGYVFDDVHAEAADLGAARDAAYQHIKATLRSTDRVAIFPTSGVHMLDFTTDLDKIHEALFALQPRTRQLGQAECPTMTHYQADLIINQHDAGALAVSTAEAAQCSNTFDPHLARDLDGRPLSARCPPAIWKPIARYA
jgi:hypothetical protein